MDEEIVCMVVEFFEVVVEIFERVVVVVKIIEMFDEVDLDNFVCCFFVVIIMGYVDYGKIMLLDFICKIKVV